MKRFSVIIHTPQELNHSSYIQTGLFELEQQGLLKVKVKLSLKKNRGMISVAEDGTLSESGRAFPKASFYTLIDHENNKEICFVTDLYDHAEHFSKTGLEKADFYFKRNYESRFADQITAGTKKEIIPLGLSFRVKSIHNKNHFKHQLSVHLTNLFLNFKLDRFFLKRLILSYKRNRKHIRNDKKNRILSCFEDFKILKKSNTILFQTRCFLHENDPDVQQIHQQRYRIIRLLRKEFPEQFTGGFIPSALANEKYRDALTTVPSEPGKYLDVLKQAKIVIYTRGLANSPAWKMAEYCSQGKVILAEPLTSELPAALTEGKEVLYFRNDEELVEKIHRVLQDEVLAEKLSKNARLYFENHIHPAKNVKRILEIMLKQPLNL